jgi:hypothetical protein
VPLGCHGEGHGRLSPPAAEPVRVAERPPRRWQEPPLGWLALRVLVLIETPMKKATDPASPDQWLVATGSSYGSKAGSRAPRVFLEEPSNQSPARRGMDLIGASVRRRLVRRANLCRFP